jgi:hypothetical protein
VTTQQEADQGFTRMPERAYRDKSQRLVHDSSSEDEEKEEGCDKENKNELIDDFIINNNTPPKRKKRRDIMVDIYNKSDLIGIEQKDMSNGLSETIFSKKKTERNQRTNKADQDEIRKYKYRKENLDVIEEHVEEIEVLNDDSDLSFESLDYDDGMQGYEPKLEDFKIIKVLDKGSFGKVFLVENKLNGKLYAMKRIRKDVLIEK